MCEKTNVISKRSYIPHADIYGHSHTLGAGDQSAQILVSESVLALGLRGSQLLAEQSGTKRRFAAHIPLPAIALGSAGGSGALRSPWLLINLPGGVQASAGDWTNVDRLLVGMGKAIFCSLCFASAA